MWQRASMFMVMDFVIRVTDAVPAATRNIVGRIFIYQLRDDYFGGKIFTINMQIQQIVPMDVLMPFKALALEQQVLLPSRLNLLRMIVEPHNARSAAVAGGVTVSLAMDAGTRTLPTMAVTAAVRLVAMLTRIVTAARRPLPFCWILQAMGLI